MKSNIYAIHHSSLIISNVKKSKQFYSDILGLECDTSRPEMTFDGLWLNINEQQQIHLLCLDNPDPLERPEHGGRDRHTAFRVNDISFLTKRLDKHKIPYTMSQSGRLALFFRDPDGNTLEMIQVPQNGKNI